MHRPDPRGLMEDATGHVTTSRHYTPLLTVVGPSLAAVCADLGDVLNYRDTTDA